MNKRPVLYIIYALLALLILIGCSKKTLPVAVVEPKAEGSVLIVDDADADVPVVKDDGYQTLIINGEAIRYDGYRAYEPTDEWDIRSMSLSDVGDFFKESFEVETSTYKLMEGSLMETEVLHVHSANEGPCVYVVGAVHGDERAAWYAALLLREATISCGDLYILAPANANGARNLTRFVTGRQDLNRSFPGDPEGNEAERLADAIFKDISDKKPSLVLDLHEAIVLTQDRDFLGSTYIFTDLTGMEDLFFDLLAATGDGVICHNEFGFNGPGPEGSVNATVTRALRIPTITVETFRGFGIERRVYDQLDTVQFILDYLGMR
jgi:Predicted deacylase